MKQESRSRLYMYHNSKKKQTRNDSRRRNADVKVNYSNWSFFTADRPHKIENATRISGGDTRRKGLPPNPTKVPFHALLIDLKTTIHTSNAQIMIYLIYLSTYIYTI